jgi:hypothetical protein
MNLNIDDTYEQLIASDSIGVNTMIVRRLREIFGPIDMADENSSTIVKTFTVTMHAGLLFAIRVHGET